MRGGWVAIVSARKSRIALFEFACTMLWLTWQRLFIHRIWPVHDTATCGRFRKCNTKLISSRGLESDRSWLTTRNSRRHHRRPDQKLQLDLFWKPLPLAKCLFKLWISEEQTREVFESAPRVDQENGRYRAVIKLMPHLPRKVVSYACLLDRGFLKSQRTENHYQIKVRFRIEEAGRSEGM